MSSLQDKARPLLEDVEVGPEHEDSGSTNSVERRNGNNVSKTITNGTSFYTNKTGRRNTLDESSRSLSRPPPIFVRAASATVSGPRVGFVPDVSRLQPDDDGSPRLRPRSSSGGISSADPRSVALRSKYMQHLGYDKLIMMGYVPNLKPLLDPPRELPELPNQDLPSPPPLGFTPRRIFVDTPRLTPQRSRSSIISLPQPFPAAAPHSDRPGEREGMVERETTAPGGVTVSPTNRAGTGGQLPRVQSAPGELSTSRGFLPPGSMKSSVFNLTSATLGAGALTIPFAVAGTGILAGLGGMVIIGLMSILSTLYIVQVMTYTDLKTMEEMALHAGGHWFAVFTEVNIILFCFGTAVGYLISVSDMFETVFREILGHNPGVVFEHTLLNRDLILIVVTVVLLLPLSLSEKLNEMRFTCFLGVSAIAFLSLVVLWELMGRGKSTSITSTEQALAPTSFWAFVNALSLITFAFSCQPNVPAIYTELERRNSRRMMKVSLRSVLLCIAVYAAMGIGGFLAFGTGTESNILLNFKDTVGRSWLVALAFIGMMAAVTFAYPLNIFPCRYSVEMMLFYSRPHLQTKFYSSLVAVLTVVLSVLLAIFVPDINFIFQLVGSTAGSFVSFIIPGILYVRLLPGATFHRRKLKAVALIVFGSAIAVLGTVVTFLPLFWDPEGKAKKEKAAAGS